MGNTYPRSITISSALPGFRNDVNWSVVHLYHRIRKTRKVKPCVTITTVQSSVRHPRSSQLNLPKWISFLNVSRNEVTLSYTSAALSPFGKR